MMDDDSHTSGEAAGGCHDHRTKKRKTIGLFHRPRNYNSTPLRNNDGNRSNPTPRADSCYYNSSATENATVWFGSSSSSSLLTPGSLDPTKELIGLPDYIVEIPPIPDLEDASCMERDDDDDVRGSRRTATRATASTPVRPLLAIRRFISPSNG
jgi:hypothetical protein